jgi:serine/threonine-protein kinase
MGEVYRADDLLIRQPVALKFLPPYATATESALSRFREEVRIARQISHPNVCRVYDIGEAEGLTFITMEYVDGENLACLLRRIGKLPREKALDVARKLCAGVAAVHDRGVLHRDLKPANIMLDGQGHVRITDFGLAALAEQVRDIESGTPAYMAPEQRAGTGVTVRSDIYSLGMVLHEIFTGMRPSPEIKSADMDPAVERIVIRCLDSDPAMRPPTVLAVSAALPGGDPISAALAAGEVPSPEAVANAGAVEGLRVPVAIACLAAVIIGLTAFSFLRLRRDLVNRIPMDNSPEVLAAKGREILKSLGYMERPVDTAFGWEYDADYLRYLAELKDDSARRAHIKANRPPALLFWYRESSRYLYNPTGYFITRTQPASLAPGMLAVLDSEGRLVELDAQSAADKHSDAAVPSFEWTRLFAAAGLDMGRFTRAEPQLLPRTYADAREAWIGPWDQTPGQTLKIEAAAYQGRPVMFRIVGPWTPAARSEPVSAGEVTFPWALAFAVVMPAAAGLLAWRNNRRGLGDRRGAFRLAAFTFVCAFVRTLAWQHHVPDIAEVGILFFAARDAMVFGALFWLVYMAFEPYVRRRSPRTLISWTRLLAGRLRDPLVGADLLIGCVLASVLLCVVRPLVSPFNPAVAPLLMSSFAGWVSAWCNPCLFAVGGALSSLFFLTVFLLIGRVQWLAAVLFIGTMSLLVATPGATVSGIIVVCSIWFALTRFGVLTASAMLFVNNVAERFPSPLAPSAWYAQSALIALLSVVILAVYAFRTTMAGRPLWSDKSGHL